MTGSLRHTSNNRNHRIASYRGSKCYLPASYKIRMQERCSELHSYNQVANHPTPSVPSPKSTTRTCRGLISDRTAYRCFPRTWNFNPQDDNTFHSVRTSYTIWTATLHVKEVHGWPNATVAREAIVRAATSFFLIVGLSIFLTVPYIYTLPRKLPTHSSTLHLEPPDPALRLCPELQELRCCDNATM